MSSRVRLSRSIASSLIVALVLVGCGSGPSAPSRPAVVAIVTASPSVAPTSGPATSPAPTSPSAVPLASAAPSPIVTLEPLISDLTGVKTDAARAHRLPLAVLLDDNRVARPQSGFNAASIIYQAPADGGETRYMLVYQEGDSNQIGPVRSARVYFAEWATEIKAGIAHYGGDLRSRQYLEAFDRARFTNIDALGPGAKAFHRIAARQAPHNGYTSTAALRAMSLKLGGPASMPAELYRRTFVEPAAQASLPVSQRIRIPYQTVAVEYRFDRTKDVYRRILDGKAQVDPADGKAVTTRNVVVLYMSFKTDTKIEPGHSRPVIGSIGSGRALVFREGRLVDGTWSKADEEAPTRLLDSAGKEIPLVVGHTFFQIVKIGTKVVIGS